jgi:hypothetical protein
MDRVHEQPRLLRQQATAAAPTGSGNCNGNEEAECLGLFLAEVFD